ncbi:unnamed protein product [Effrenium voratum]|nr:unnamed protein product [Effrenium voratum]
MGQKPSKNSPELSWSFLFQIPSAELTQPLQVLSASTETVSFSLAWSASVVFSCRAGANHSAPQLAARNVLAVVHLGDLHPDSHYEVECQATLQDEPDVVSEWLPAGHVQTATDYSVQLDALFLRVQPLCPSNPLHAYDMPVVPTLEANRSDYSVALPNADFALNCTASEATWQLELHAAASSSYASVAVSWNQTSQESELPIMMLPADQVVVTTTFRVAVEAGCRCRSGLITVQVMGLRLSFELGDIEVTRSTGDPVSLQEVDEGQKLEVVVTYSNEALPAELWGQLAFYLGPFPQELAMA